MRLELNGHGYESVINLESGEWIFPKGEGLEKFGNPSAILFKGGNIRKKK